MDCPYFGGGISHEQCLMVWNCPKVVSYALGVASAGSSLPTSLGSDVAVMALSMMPWVQSTPELAPGLASLAY